MRRYSGLDTLNVHTKNSTKKIENQEGGDDVNFFWINVFFWLDIHAWFIDSWHSDNKEFCKQTFYGSILLYIYTSLL